MKNQVLSIEQMQKLKELGVDTSNASMHFLYMPTAKSIMSGVYEVDDEPEIFVSQHGVNHEHPTFTLQDIIELLPAKIQRNTEYDLTIYKDFLLYSCQGKNQFAACRPLIFFNAVELFTDSEIGLIGAAYEMLVWVAENGYLTSK